MRPGGGWTAWWCSREVRHEHGEPARRPAATWRGWFPALSVLDAPGDHYAMVQPPCVDELAASSTASSTTGSTACSTPGAPARDAAARTVLPPAA